MWRLSDSPKQCSQTSWNVWYIGDHWSVCDSVSVVLLDFWLLCDLQEVRLIDMYAFCRTLRIKLACLFSDTWQLQSFHSAKYKDGFE